MDKMTLAEILYKRDPKAEYTLGGTDDQAEIVSWKGPGEKPGRAELEALASEAAERKAAEAAREQRRAGLRGKRIKQLSALERDELLTVLAERLGLVDADGVIV